MTPNLTRLFQIANRGTGFSLETQLTSEKMLRKLFMCHGEALLAALERECTLLMNCEYWLSDLPSNYDNMVRTAQSRIRLELSTVTELLAQLEQEAQP